MAKTELIEDAAPQAAPAPKGDTNYVTTRAGLRWRGKEYKADEAITLPTIIGAQLLEKGAVKPA